MADNPWGKRPRHYAEEIVRLKTKDERREALERVPCPNLVRAHVEAFAAQRAARKMREKKS